jgi:hypothetical protein
MGARASASTRTPGFENTLTYHVRGTSADVREIHVTANVTSPRLASQALSALECAANEICVRSYGPPLPAAFSAGAALRKPITAMIGDRRVWTEIQEYDRNSPARGGFTVRYHFTPVPSH